MERTQTLEGAAMNQKKKKPFSVEAADKMEGKDLFYFLKYKNGRQRSFDSKLHYTSQNIK